MCNRVVNTKREKNEMFDFPSTPHYLEGICVYAALNVSGAIIHGINKKRVPGIRALHHTTNHHTKNANHIDSPLLILLLLLLLLLLLCLFEGSSFGSIHQYFFQIFWQ